ncbi:MAG: YigZ family protein [Lachnospiraceae bacterium]|nr:YigZ family protein [Lachnospiraceae bacterium]
MVSEYYTVLEDASGEITEKRSRFIAVIHHVENEDEALSFIESIKKEHWDARHNCFAYVIGTDQPLERASDDGEPSRTAGLPILESIKTSGLTNVCIVVTRYFGGILLGTGPLAKAYRDSSHEAIINSEIIRMRCLMNVLFTLDYDSYGKIRYEAEKRNIKIVDTQFADKVFVRMAMTHGEFDHMSAYLNDVSRGTGAVLSDGEIWISEKKE